MGKYLVAAALAGCSVLPAQAATYVTMLGWAKVNTYSISNGQLTSSVYRDVEITGFCDNSPANLPGGSCNLTDFPNTSFVMNWTKGTAAGTVFFDYMPDVFAPNDGVMHSGVGTGTYSYTTLSADLTIISVKRETRTIGFSQSAAPDVSFSLPEPSTWAMMFAGFGLKGGAIRRRRVQETRSSMN